ncbi:MAG: hypothetical protein KJ607_09120, partial [Bacteroidetes bacterium]|nr:hypothetical protein [Bacteroidota bacterium]
MKKKILFFVLAVCYVLSSAYSADHFTESFTNAFDIVNYTDGIVTLGTGDWEIYQVRGEAATNSYGSTGNAARLNDDIAGGSYLTTPGVNSVGNMSFYYRELNSGGGTFKVQKSVDGGTFIDLDSRTFSGLTYAFYSFDVNDTSDNVRIRIISDNNAGHLIIDELTLSDYDITPPDVTAAPQTVTNASGQTVQVQSSEDNGNVYIILDGMPQSDLTELNNAVSGNNGAIASVTVAYSDVDISTYAITPGNYYAYAVDASENISVKGTNLIQVSDGMAPSMISAERVSATGIEITLTKEADPATITALNDGGFTVFETGTPAITYAVTEINPGATNDIVSITVNNFSASHAAGLTVTYTAGGNGIVADTSANTMETDLTGVTISIWGQPVIASVIFTDGNYKIGDTVDALITADNSGLDEGPITINGQPVTGFTDNNDSTYTVTCTVQDGDPDASQAADIAVSVVLGYDGAFCNPFTGPGTGNVTIDANRPVFSSIIRDNDMQITVTLNEVADTVTTTAANDGGFTVHETGTPALTYPVTEINPGATNDQVVLTVTDFGASNAAGITVKYTAGGNGLVTDTAGNTMNSETTGFETGQWGFPVISGVNFANGDYGIGDTIVVTVTADGIGYTVDSISVNGQAVSDFTDNNDGTYTFYYIIQENDTEADQAADIAVYIVLDNNGLTNTAYTSAGTGNVTVDSHRPFITGAIRNNDTQITVTLNENADVATITLANDGGFTVYETGIPFITYDVIAVNPGATYNEAVLTVADMNASGETGVTVTYTQGGNGIVADVAGNTMNSDTTGAEITAWISSGATDLFISEYHEP